MEKEIDMKDLSKIKKKSTFMNGKYIADERLLVEVPEVRCKCQKCGQRQEAAGHLRTFTCKACKRESRGYPKYGIYECPKCNYQVCFQLGERLMQCTVCQLVVELTLKGAIPFVEQQEEELQARSDMTGPEHSLLRLN